MGFRGDWKALVQVFNLTRTYNHDEARNGKTDKIPMSSQTCFGCFCSNNLFQLFGKNVCPSDMLALSSHERLAFVGPSIYKCCWQRKMVVNTTGRITMGGAAPLCTFTGVFVRNDSPWLASYLESGDGLISGWLDFWSIYYKNKLCSMDRIWMYVFHKQLSRFVPTRNRESFH